MARLEPCKSSQLHHYGMEGWDHQVLPHNGHQGTADAQAQGPGADKALKGMTPWWDARSLARSQSGDGDILGQPLPLEKPITWSRVLVAQPEGMMEK